MRIDSFKMEIMGQFETSLSRKPCTVLIFQKNDIVSMYLEYFVF